MSERMMVCVMHSAFTASALFLIFKHKRVFLGLFACLLLHFLGNFPIFLAGKNAFGIGTKAWQVILQVWVMLYFLGQSPCLHDIWETMVPQTCSR